MHYQFNKAVAMSVVGYLAQYSNAVGTVVVPLETGGSTQQFQAVGSRRIGGIQGEGSYRSSKLNVWWNFTYTNPLDLSDNERLSDIANYMINAGANYPITQKLALYVSGNYVSARQSGVTTSGSNNPIATFAPYMVVNTNLTYHNLLNGLSVQLSVNNALNKEYFVPGIREADNTTYVSRFPQERRLVSVGIYYTLAPN